MKYNTLDNRTSSQDSTEPSHAKTYEWSIDNLLSKTTNGNNPEVAYEYDARGLLSKRTENSQSDNFVWDETSINALLIADGDYEYVYGANRVPIAQIDLTDNSIEYLHTDTNGSVIALTGVDGYLAGITNYGAYGKRQGSAISRFGFAGEWVDPTTEYAYLRARWYDPSTGQVISSAKTHYTRSHKKPTGTQTVIHYQTLTPPLDSPQMTSARGLDSWHQMLYHLWIHKHSKISVM